VEYVQRRIDGIVYHSVKNEKKFQTYLAN